MTAPDAALVAYVALLANGSPVDYGYRPDESDERPALTAEHLAVCGLEPSTLVSRDPSWEIEGCTSKGYLGCDGNVGRPRFEEFVHCACDDYVGPILVWSPEPVEYAAAVLAAAEQVAEARRRAALTVVPGGRS